MLNDLVDNNDAPNFGLLMLWASLANAIPVSTMSILLLLHVFIILSAVWM